MSNMYLCTISSRLWHSGSLSQLVGLMTQGSLTHLPLLLKLLEIPFNVGEGTFPTHDTVTMNQRKKKKEKAVLDQTTPNNVVLTYNHLYLHTPDKGFRCFLER